MLLRLLANLAHTSLTSVSIPFSRKKSLKRAVLSFPAEALPDRLQSAQKGAGRVAGEGNTPFAERKEVLAVHGNVLQGVLPRK